MARASLAAMLSPLKTAALLAPALAVMAVAGFIPLAIVLFYSVHDTFAGNAFIYVGFDWYRQVLSAPEFWHSLGLSFAFALLSLSIQVPLGLYVALKMPQGGPVATAIIIVIAVPLLTPAIVVGYLWKVMSLEGAGLLPAMAGLFGLSWDMNSVAVSWATLALMDAWHWTSLVVLLCHAGLKAIPDDHYRAARIDGAGRLAVFRHIQLPRLKAVLMIAILMRFMDAFMIYAEPLVVTRGGPGISTTFLSHELVQTATIQFDLGEGGAMSVIYLCIVLAVSWAVFRVIAPSDTAQGRAP
jgi:glycerol transport system permease protein